MSAETTAEMLGGVPEAQTAYGLGRATAIQPVSADYGRISYEGYEKLYHGRLPNYELGGLFVKSIVRHIANFTLGRGVTLRVDEPPLVTQGADGQTIEGPSHTNQLLARWSAARQRDLLQIAIECLKLGDHYTAIDDDGTLVHIPPTAVDVQLDGYGRRPAAIRIHARRVELAGNNQPVEYIYRDTRTAERRVVERRSVRSRDIPSSWQPISDEPNLIGRIDVVHWANERGPSDVYGLPEAYALLTLLRRYDDLLNWAITGNKLMGRPTPVFEGIKDVAQFVALFGRDVEDLATGQVRKVVDWAPEQVQVLGEGASFRLASPAAFADDTQTLLNILFWVLAQHSSIPEFIWGTAVASSKASVSEQMPPFLKFIEGKQGQFEGSPADPLLGSAAQGGFHELTDIWLRKRRLHDARIAIDVPTIVTWPDITDREGVLTQLWAQTLRDEGVLSDQTLLGIGNAALGEPVADVAAEVARARADRLRTSGAAVEPDAAPDPAAALRAELTGQGAA